MDKPKLLEALAALPESGVKRTKTGRIRELLPEIEAAQSAGYANEDIAKALTRQGLEVTKKTLETMLYRIRKERGESTPPAHKLASTPASVLKATPPPTPEQSGSAPEGAPSSMAGGKLMSETILETPSKSYSFKQLNKTKETK